MGQESERRRIARVSFGPPLTGKFASIDVDVLDLSVDGATVLPRQPLLLGSHSSLRFPYRAADVHLPCRVIRLDSSPFKDPVTGKNRLHAVLVFEELDARARRELEEVLSVEIENLRSRPGGNPLG